MPNVRPSSIIREGIRANQTMSDLALDQRIKAIAKMAEDMQIPLMLLCFHSLLQGIMSNHVMLNCPEKSKECIKNNLAVWAALEEAIQEEFPLTVEQVANARLRGQLSLHRN